MERQVHHLNRLVDDLLEVSRITRGVIEVKKEPVDLTAIVKTVIETSRPVLDNLRHEIRAELEPNQICVGGDAVRLTQVFSNLLNNAAKYTNHGGVITVTTRREGSEAVVGVKDNGIGIAPNLLTQVFDMFMQVDRSTRRSQGGLGIGLALTPPGYKHGEGVFVPSKGGTVALGSWREESAEKRAGRSRPIKGRTSMRRNSVRARKSRTNGRAEAAVAP